jgi:hypothetical protein
MRLSLSRSSLQRRETSILASELAGGTSRLWRPLPSFWPISTWRLMTRITGTLLWKPRELTCRGNALRNSGAWRAGVVLKTYESLGRRGRTRWRSLDTRQSRTLA